MGYNGEYPDEQQPAADEGSDNDDADAVYELFKCECRCCDL